MKYLLYLSGIGGIGMAVLIAQVAKSAVHEIEALMFVLIAAVCIAGGAVIQAIQDHKSVG